METREEFVTMLLRHEPELRGFICALCGDPSEREDLFQETALAMWRGYGELRQQASFAAWGRGIAANLMLQNRSRKSRAAIVLSPEAMEAVLKAFERTESDAGERKQALNACIEKLPPRSREMLTLRYEQGLRGAEIAARMDASLDVVHQTLSRVRAALAECIRRRMGWREKGEDI